jgi:hypothetical protein
MVAGFNAHLMKPVTPEAFESMLRSQILHHEVPRHHSCTIVACDSLNQGFNRWSTTQ